MPYGTLIFGKIYPPVGIPVYEVDVPPGLEPGTAPTRNEVLVELIASRGALQPSMRLTKRIKINSLYIFTLISPII